MGYQVRHNLEILPWSDEIMGDILSNVKEAKSAFNKEGKSEEPVTWYKVISDLKVIANKYPNHILVLDMDGEEPGDLRKVFFRGEKDFQTTAILTFSEEPELFKTTEEQVQMALDHSKTFISQEQLYKEKALEHLNLKIKEAEAKIKKAEDKIKAFDSYLKVKTKSD